jgi:predicted TIM-barrel fold metal-dependent hydrolase
MFDFANPGYEIIDAHVHPGSFYSYLETKDFGGKDLDDNFLLTLKSAGISRCAGSVACRLSGDFTWETIHGLNLRALQLRDSSDGFVIPGICVHPRFEKESLEEIDYMYHKENVRFIGELVAYMMDYTNYARPEMMPFWDLATQLGMVVNLHLSNLDEARMILKNFPDMKLVIAHPTADANEYEARMRLVAQYPNAALDISGSGPNTWGMLRRGINWAGKEKLLFGTDFPIRNPGMYVAGVLFERLTDDENTAIFAGNFKRLMNM